MRLAFVTIGASTLTAPLLFNLTGWAPWLTTAIGVVLISAAATPPFLRPPTQ